MGEMALPSLIEVAFIVITYSVGSYLSDVRAYTWTHHHVSPLYVRFVAKCLQILSYVGLGGAVGTMAGLDVKGLSTTLMTSGSLAIGFASQDILKNLASGFVIMATKPFEVRDKITCDGKTGIVVEVGFFSTRLKTSDETGLSLPNGKVASAVLVNQTDTYGIAKSGMHRVKVPLHLSVQADLDAALKVLGNVAKDMDAYLKELNKSDFKHGQTMKQYHHSRFGMDLDDEQAVRPTKVAVIGQNIQSGFDVEVQCFTDEVLVTKVFQEGFKRSVRALKTAGVELFDRSIERVQMSK